MSDGNSDKKFEMMIAPSSFSSLKASLRVLGHRSVSLRAVAYLRQSLTASIYSIEFAGRLKNICCRHIVSRIDEFLVTKKTIGPAGAVLHTSMVRLSVGHSLHCYTISPVAML